MKKLDKILDNVMRFLMAVAMFALHLADLYPLDPAQPLHRYGRVSALCPDLGFHDRFRLLLLQG